jgi:hypothetical protein
MVALNNLAIIVGSWISMSVASLIESP